MRKQLPALAGRSSWVVFFSLLALTCLSYYPAWHGGFIWDDDSHLTKNPCIIGALGFKGIWTTAAATYYPLVLSNFWVQHALWGLNPLPYHLVNIAMHAACGILLWQVLRRLNVIGAWLGAAMWALHPVQVESVAWITELKNTQSCLFYLLAILFFLRWREAASVQDRHHAGRDYVVALVCAAFAILSKSSTVMLPVVLGLCLWWRDGRWHWRNVVPLVPFFVLSVLAAAWTIWEQKFHSGAAGTEWSQSWPERLIIAGLDVWFYLGKLAWPHPLIFNYPRWSIDASQPLMYLPFLLAIATMFALWGGRNGRMRPLFFAAAYFVVSLFPVLGFFNVYYFRYSFVGDHFQYLASIGPLALLAAGITTALRFFEGKQPFLKPVVCSALLLSVGLLSWRQCADYTDIETLWRTTIARNPDSWLAHNNLSVLLLNKGAVEESFVHTQRSLEINPRVPETHKAFADVLIRTGRVDEAIIHYEKAVAIDPGYSAGHNNLGAALLQMGRLQECVAHLEKSVKINPYHADAYSNLGNALLQMGRVEDSFAYLQKALEIDPAYADAHFNLANTLLKMGRLDESVEHLEKVLAINPDDAEAHSHLAEVLVRLGRADDAAVHYKKARDNGSNR